MIGCRAALAVVASTLFLVGSAGIAGAQAPAVSDVNVKISAFGGGLTAGDIKDGVGGLAGSLTLPVGRAFGLQLDGSYARVDDANFGNAGAHLFWRNPEVGLVGIYAGYARLDKFGGLDVGRVVGEAQYFLKNLTIDGAAGFRYGDVDGKGYGRARLQYYPVKNVMLQSGWLYEGRSYGSLGLESQLFTGPSAGWSLFADGNVNNKDNYSVLAGFKVVFGKDMSLIDRHRRQDPENYTHVDLLSTQQAADRVRKRTSTTSASVCARSVILPTSDTCVCPSPSLRTTFFTPPGTFTCAVP